MTFLPRSPVMWSYLFALLLHAGLLGAICWWHLRAYRKAAHRSRRRVERMVAEARSAAYEAEIEYLRERQDILLRGLFPRGEVFVGNFVEQDPELRALCELLEIFRDRHTDQSPLTSSPPRSGE